MSAKKQFTIFTKEGVSFDETGATLIEAVRRSKPLTDGYDIVAVIETASVVTPSPGKMTALIVRPPSEKMSPSL
jgi:hypothetical protein